MSGIPDDGTARDACTAVAARVRELIVLARMHHEGTAIGIEYRRHGGTKRDSRRRHLKAADAVGQDVDVRQVAGVGTTGIRQSVMRGRRVVVPTRVGERRAGARTCRVNVEPVQTGGGAHDRDADTDRSRAVLAKLRGSDSSTCLLYTSDAADERSS